MSEEALRRIAENRRSPDLDKCLELPRIPHQGAPSQASDFHGRSTSRRVGGTQLKASFHVLVASYGNLALLHSQLSTWSTSWSKNRR